MAGQLQVCDWNAEEADAGDCIVSFHVKNVDNQNEFVNLFQAGKGVLDAPAGANIFTWMMVFNNLMMLVAKLFTKTKKK